MWLDKTECFICKISGEGEYSLKQEDRIMLLTLHILLNTSWSQQKSWKAKHTLTNSLTWRLYTDKREKGATLLHRYITPLKYWKETNKKRKPGDFFQKLASKSQVRHHTACGKETRQRVFFAMMFSLLKKKNMRKQKKREARYQIWWGNLTSQMQWCICLPTYTLICSLPEMLRFCLSSCGSRIQENALVTKKISSSASVGILPEFRCCSSLEE